MRRYTPVGLLDRVEGKGGGEPRQRINERQPAFCARSDLEALLASQRVEDWVKITEMFLGPHTGACGFKPRHSSKAY